MDPWGVPIESPLVVDGRREHIEVHVHEFGSVDGLASRFGDNRHDRFADVAHLIDSQRKSLPRFGDVRSCAVEQQVGVRATAIVTGSSGDLLATTERSQQELSVTITTSRHRTPVNLPQLA